MDKQAGIVKNKEKPDAGKSVNQSATTDISGVPAPENRTDFRELIKIFREQNNSFSGITSECTRAFDSEKTDSTNRVTLLTERGDACKETGEYDEAAKAYEKALVHAGDDEKQKTVLREKLGDAYVGLADKQIKEGKFSEAAKAYEKALVHAGDDEKQKTALQEKLGDASMKTGELGKAVGAYEQALIHAGDDEKQKTALQQKMGDAYVGLADKQIKEGKFSEAIKAYEKALKNSRGLSREQKAVLQEKLGDACMKNERPEDAIEHFEKALKIGGLTETEQNNTRLVLFNLYTSSMENFNLDDSLELADYINQNRLYPDNNTTPDSDNNTTPGPLYLEEAFKLLKEMNDQSNSRKKLDNACRKLGDACLKSTSTRAEVAKAGLTAHNIRLELAKDIKKEAVSDIHLNMIRSYNRTGEILLQDAENRMGSNQKKARNPASGLLDEAAENYRMFFSYLQENGARFQEKFPDKEGSLDEEHNNLLQKRLQLGQLRLKNIQTEKAVSALETAVGDHKSYLDSHQGGYSHHLPSSLLNAQGKLARFCITHHKATHSTATNDTAANNTAAEAVSKFEEEIQDCKKHLGNLDKANKDLLESDIETARKTLEDMKKELEDSTDGRE